MKKHIERDFMHAVEVEKGDGLGTLSENDGKLILTVPDGETRIFDAKDMAESLFKVN